MLQTDWSILIQTTDWLQPGDSRKKYFINTDNFFSASISVNPLIGYRGSAQGERTLLADYVSYILYGFAGPDPLMRASPPSSATLKVVRPPCSRY